VSQGPTVVAADRNSKQSRSVVWKSHSADAGSFRVHTLATLLPCRRIKTSQLLLLMTFGSAHQLTNRTEETRAATRVDGLRHRLPP